MVSPESARPSLSRELCIVEIEILCLSVCKDVCRNPGGIIKLQERLLNEGSGRNMRIIQAFKIYGCKRSKIFGNIQVSMALFFRLVYIKAMTFLVFNLEANNVLL